MDSVSFPESGRLVASEERFIDQRRRLFLHRFRHVRIDVERDLRRRVSEPFADHLDVYTLLRG